MAGEDVVMLEGREHAAHPAASALTTASGLPGPGCRRTGAPASETVTVRFAASEDSLQQVDDVALVG